MNIQIGLTHIKQERERKKLESDRRVSKVGGVCGILYDVWCFNDYILVHKDISSTLIRC